MSMHLLEKNGVMGWYSTQHDDFDPIRCWECDGTFTPEEWDNRHSNEDGEDVHAHCCVSCANDDDLPTFDVLVREVHISHMIVKALDEEDAIRKVAEGGGEEVYLEYSHTLDRDKWTVEEEISD